MLTEIRRLLPAADLLYVADHAAAPYGVRSLAEVRERADFVARWLIDRGSEVVTIACNTASAAALHSLRTDHPGTAFVGMEPAIKPAIALTGRGRVGVVATAATFQGELFASVVDRFAGSARIVTAACPRWVELVEAGSTDDDEAADAVADCLGPMKSEGVDVIVLACTHYPALTGLISGFMGPEVEIVDPAPAVARQTARLATETGAGSGRGLTELTSTGDTALLLRAARRLGIEAGATVLPWTGDGPA